MAKGDRQIRQRQMCVFCGQNPASSKEDVWPKWIQRNLPPVRNGTSTLQHGQIVKELDLSAKPPCLVRKQLVRSGRKEAQKARVVCATCNNGWMSRLETAVKRPVTRLVEDELTKLDTAEQTTMALWASKTALMMEKTNAATVTSPQENYRHVFTEQAPPPNTYISLFRRHQVTPWEAHFLHSAKAVYNFGPPQSIEGIQIAAGSTPLIGTVTFSLGQLGVYVYSAYNMPPVAPPMWAFGRFQQVVLWPPEVRQLRFPPLRDVTSDQYRTAAMRAQNLPI